MASHNVQVVNVNNLKKSLSKELTKLNEDGSDDEDDNTPNTRCLDILKRLDEVPISMAILKETLVGTVVSKFKSNKNDEIASTAKALIKKWKRVAKKEGLNAKKPSTSPTTTNPTKAKIKPEPVAASPTTPTTTPNSAAKLSSTSPSNDSTVENEWKHLPPHRSKMASKFHQIFLTSSESLLQTGLSSSALTPLILSRATEVEEAIYVASGGKQSDYSSKIRSLIFNTKKNSNLREKVILGFTTVQALVKMTPEELATEQRSKERKETAKKVQDSLRLDWEQANEEKINEQCGIKGELLKASLFTCGRCKSTKTTSTQKQTRSADEPMTVFVYCLNCGKRWKC